MVIRFFSFVDLEDVGEAAKLVLMKLNYQNATYGLAGTLPASHVEAAEVFSRALNYDVRVEKRKLRIGNSAQSEVGVLREHSRSAMSTG